MEKMGYTQWSFMEPGIMKLCSFLENQMSLKILMLSRMSQTWKDKYHFLYPMQDRVGGRGERKERRGRERQSRIGTLSGRIKHLKGRGNKRGNRKKDKITLFL